jgi:DNA repair exonuclease SbcCD ATPase subunit
MCFLLTVCGTLLVIGFGILVTELNFKSTESIMALQDRLKHLEVAHELVKSHAAAQKAELAQLRPENERLTDANELMREHTTAQKIQHAQLQLDNEQLKGLASTLTHTKEDHEASLRHAVQKTAAMMSQNTELAKKLMASRRQAFKLEQEKREQMRLLQELTNIKTLVKDNTTAIQDLDKWIKTAGTDTSCPDSGRSRGCGTPCSTSSSMNSTDTSSPHARELLDTIHDFLLEGCSINRRLARLRSRSGSRSGLTSSSFSITSNDTETSHMSTHELRQTLQARLDTITSFAWAFARARGYGGSESNTSRCGSQQSRRLDSGTCLGMSMQMACS